MKVIDVMTPLVASVTSDTPIKSVFEIIFQKKINAVPVTDKKKKLVGIITKEDLLKLLYPNMIDFLGEFEDSGSYQEMEKTVPELKNKRAEEVMCTRVIFAGSETPAMRALSRMLAQRVRQLPVVDEEGQVIGIITQGDVFYRLFQTSQKRKPVMGKR